MATEAKSVDAPVQKHSVLNSSFPVLLPYDEAIFLPEDQFQVLMRKLAIYSRHPQLDGFEDELPAIAEGTASARKRAAFGDSGDEPPKKSPFIEGMERHASRIMTEEDLTTNNKALTWNNDVTNISSKNPLIDLFYDLKETTSSKELPIIMRRAWKKDALMTLKIIFNARSIHLGKSSRNTLYKTLGWLADFHPATLLANLPWLVRPVIEKKAPKQKTEDDHGADGVENGLSEPAEDGAVEDGFDIIDGSEGTSDPLKAHDVKHGVSHGYYKDLLNLVVFAANDELHYDIDPTSSLNQPEKKPKQPGKKLKQRGKKPKQERQHVEWYSSRAKESRRMKKQAQHAHVVKKLENDGFYRALHLTVARIFAQQLKEDRALLDSGTKTNLRKLSLAAKWAPSFSEFHDKYTFILSTIAEILYPDPAAICPDAGNRELYLRHAREAVRKNYTSPLRKALAIVERDIVSGNFGNIKYERVPSLAMDRYAPLFIKKDSEHFSSYVHNVASGDAKISGATLLPSTLVSKARTIASKLMKANKKGFEGMKVSANAHLTQNVIEGQWRSLVQRVKDSGVLDSSIAVCDVSGSMMGPRNVEDGTEPIDSAIGLTLLVSEVTAPPFGGGFITFSANPSYVAIENNKDKHSLVEQVAQLERADWGGNTNFVAVFETLILPMALHNRLDPKDMVKQVFVFSDMQFDCADNRSSRWATSYERIKQKYAFAGYAMPKLIFWNLAATSTSKPVTMEDKNTALVSGYSQGMLKMFLDGGGFENDAEEIVEEVGVEDDMVEVQVRKKIDPMSIVKKAVSHKAYSMLQVVD